jgi:hypothetical protein
VSSILDALAKLEASRQPTGLVDPSRPPLPVRRRPTAMLLVIGAFVAGIGVTAVALWRRPAEPPAAVPAIVPAPPPPAVPTVVADAPPPTLPPPAAAVKAPEPVTVAKAVPSDGLRAAPPVAAPAGQDLPWGRPVVPPPPPEADVAEPPPTTNGRLAVALAPRAEPMPLPAVPANPPPAARPPAGAPNIRLSFLLYSSHPERRSVALTIDGGGLTTLHEGDDHEGVEVVRIHPDHVDLRWQGEAFSVEARN